MDTLTDDCQIRIIRLMDLRDQLMVFEATKGETTNRWHSNIRNTWEQKMDFFLHWNAFEVFERNPELFKDFLSIISPTVYKFQLYYVNPKILECMTNFEYPEMRSLSLIRRNNELNNEVTPIVQILSKCSKKLEELELFEENLDEEQLGLALKLPKLERLTLGLMQEKFLDFVIKKRAKQITKLTMHDIHLPYMKTMNKLLNLRQLTIGYRYMMEHIMKGGVIAPLPSLEQLDIEIETEDFSFEQLLFNFVVKYPSIKLLNLCNQLLDMEFYLKNKHHLKIASMTRSTPLFLYFDGKSNDIDMRKTRSYFENLNIVVSLKALETDSIDEESVIFEFNSGKNK